MYGHIDVGYTDSDEENRINQISFTILPNYSSYRTSNTNGFYYELENKKSKYKYLVINYSGYYSFLEGYLTVTTYDSNPLGNSSKLTLIILGIVFAGNILIVIIFVICFCCYCRKKSPNYVPGINTVNPIMPAYPQQPFINTNQPYQTYQPY